MVLSIGKCGSGVKGLVPMERRDDAKQCEMLCQWKPKSINRLTGGAPLLLKRYPVFPIWRTGSAAVGRNENPYGKYLRMGRDSHSDRLRMGPAYRPT
jgi:hypothetical protein